MKPEERENLVNNLVANLKVKINL